jgi:hypothetical protein
MSRSRQISKPRPVTTLRPGEGTILNIQRLASSETEHSFAIDTSRVPVPDRKYLADVCSVVRSRSGFNLLFAQERIGSGELRSLLVVHVALSTVMHFLDSVEKMEKPTFAELLRSNKITLEPILETILEPQQTVALSSTFMLMAISAADACLDFLQASPFSMAALEHSGQLAVEPVVRVEVGTGSMWGLIEKLKDITSKTKTS